MSTSSIDLHGLLDDCICVRMCVYVMCVFVCEILWKRATWVAGRPCVGCKSVPCLGIDIVSGVEVTE